MLLAIAAEVKYDFKFQKKFHFMGILAQSMGLSFWSTAIHFTTLIDGFMNNITIKTIFCIKKRIYLEMLTSHLLAYLTLCFKHMTVNRTKQNNKQGNIEFVPVPVILKINEIIFI